MTKAEVEEYLIELEEELLFKNGEQAIELTKEWAKAFPGQGAVYLFREAGKVCYVGECARLSRGMLDFLDTRRSLMRRRVGDYYYMTLPNFERASYRRKFPAEIEELLDFKIVDDFTMSYILVDLGRKELEEWLCKKLRPRYCSVGSGGQIYKMDERQLVHRNAFARWTKEDDQKLELLFCERKSIEELCDLFGRSSGGIYARIEKLELVEKYGG